MVYIQSKDKTTQEDTNITVHLQD